MKGARINFGVPNSEYVLLADDGGAAVSLKNQDTDNEKTINVILYKGNAYAYAMTGLMLLIPRF